MIVWFNTMAPGSKMPEKPLPKELYAIQIGVDVTEEGTHVVALYAREDGTSEVIYSQFHPMETIQRPYV